MTINTEAPPGEIVESVELVPVDQAAPVTLFGTSDPDVALARMSKVATALVDVIRDRGLVVRISGREHLTAEAWTTLGGMLGVVPVVTWTRPLEDRSGWEARVEARTLDGRVVGAAESMCTRSESTWRARDEFALRSMAQTRAIGRALRAPLGQIVRLAGYDPAAAEEMPTAAEPEPAGTGIVRDEHATPDQKEEINALLHELQKADPDQDWKQIARGIAGGKPGELGRGQADTVILRLGERLVALEEAA